MAETGGDMARFATAARLAAWGLPAKHPPPAKATGTCAWRWSRRPGPRRTRTRPGARFRRLARRFGKGNEKKAAVAVAHTLLCIAWAVMHYDGDYVDATPTTTSGATSATASIWSATTSRLWPGSACKLSSPSLVTAARRQLQAPRPPPGRLTLTAPHRRATQPAPLALPRAWLGSPSFVTGTPAEV